MGILPTIHGLQARATSTASCSIPSRRASAGMLPFDTGFSPWHCQARGFLPEQASAWLLDEGIHPYPLIRSRTPANLILCTLREQSGKIGCKSGTTG